MIWDGTHNHRTRINVPSEVSTTSSLAVRSTVPITTRNSRNVRPRRENCNISCSSKSPLRRYINKTGKYVEKYHSQRKRVVSVPTRNMVLYLFRSSRLYGISIIETQVELRCFDPWPRRLPFEAFDFVNYKPCIVNWREIHTEIGEYGAPVITRFFLFNISCSDILIFWSVCEWTFVRVLTKVGRERVSLPALTTHGYNEVKGISVSRLNPSSAIQWRMSWDTCIRFYRTLDSSHACKVIVRSS